MEHQPAPEKRIPTISGNDVVREYREFQSNARLGFKTEEQRLEGYLGLISTVHGYFSQKNILEHRQEEVKKVVDVIFHNNDGRSSDKIEFFREASQKVKKEVSPPGQIRRPPSEIRRDEFEIFGRLLEVELGKTAQAYESERMDTQHLYNLAQRSSELPPGSVPNFSLEQIENKKREVNRLLVETLSKEPGLKDDVALAHNYIRTLEQLADQQIISSQALRQTLEHFRQFTSDPDMMDDLSLHADLGNMQYVRRVLTELKETSDLTGLLFQKWVNEGEISGELYGSYQEILALSELQQTASVLSDASPATKARYLLPFKDQGISSSLLREMAEGRVELQEDLLANLVETYLDLYKNEIPKNAVKNHSNTKSKVATAIIIAALAATPFIYRSTVNKTNYETAVPFPDISLQEEGYVGDKILEQQAAPVDQEKAQKENSKTNEEGGIEPRSLDDYFGTTEGLDASGLSIGQVQSSSPGSGSRINSSGSSSGQGEYSEEGVGANVALGQRGDNPFVEEARRDPDKESYSLPNSTQPLGRNSTPASGNTEPGSAVPGTNRNPDFLRPVNDSIEGMKEAQKRVAWNIEGEDLLGLYRMRSASQFSDFDKGWIFSRNVIRGMQPYLSSQRDIRLSGEIKLTGQLVPLPTRMNYAPARGSIRVSGVESSPELIETSDGNYFLVFPKEDISKTIRVTYSLGKSEKGIVPPPTPSETARMIQKSIEIEDLPNGDLKNFMLNLRSGNLPAEAKAKLIEKYFQDNFIYSLDPKWSNEYHKGNVKTFFRKIAEIKRVDCDVANTAMIMMLRAQGIPSRFVYGSAHNGGVVNPNEKQITDAESHGWTEAYIGGRWYQLDGTPNKIERSTELGLTEGKTMEQVEAVKEQERILVEAASWMRWVKDETIIPQLLGATILNLLALRFEKILRLKNVNHGKKLRRELNSRATAYLGKGNEGLQDLFTRRDRAIINDLTPDYFNPLNLLPPVALLYGLPEQIARTVMLRSHPPFNKLLDGTITQSANPQIFEFLTKILGYPERQVRRRLNRQNYKAAMDNIDRRRGSLLVTLYDGDIISGYSTGIEKALRSLREPQSIDSWDQQKSLIRNNAYWSYLKMRQKEEKLLISEGDKPANIPPRMTPEKFGARLEKLFRLKLAEWALRSAYIETLKEL